MTATTRSRIMSTSSSSSSSSSTTTARTIHDAMVTAWDHPRTMILGGLIIYFVGGLTLFHDNPKSRKAYFRPITSISKIVLSVVGFASALVWDIQDAYNDGRTQLWSQGLDSLKLFLKESGLDQEFSTTMTSNHFLTSTIVLTDLQNKVQRQRRSQLKKHHPEQQQQHDASAPPSTTIRSRDIDETTNDDDNRKNKDLQQALIDGQHYMRFATAVYGEEMMAGAELAVKGETNISPTDSNNTCIVKHCQLRSSGGEPGDATATTGGATTTDKTTTVGDDDDEIWCDYDYDFSTAKHPHAQNCTVIACPHKQEIILSIRGTFSLSGIITDLAGYCEPFCNGMAHSGMASASNDTWDTVWNQIIKPKLEENNNSQRKIKYNRFTVTGHSLGAGVACLVTILIYHQQLSELKDYEIKCYAMAPPPVFCPLEKAPNAVANTIAYINNYDIVPSLSVDAIRRLMACLDRIVAVLQSNPIWDLAAKRWQLGEPQPELLDAYHPKSPLEEKTKAPMVLIPASKIIWMEKDPTLSDKIVYEAHSLCPTKYADRVLDLELPDCVSDHMSDCYEVAFDHLVVQK